MESLGQLQGFQLPLLLLLAWGLFWKGFALWRAAKNNQRNWFIAILMPINTLGILEMVYLFGFCKKRLQLKELRFWE